MIKLMMKRYAMLMLPSNNRVYNAAADKLAHAELQCFNASVLDNRLTNVQSEPIAGVPYLCFESPPLSDNAIGYLSNLSFLYALYEIEGEQHAQCLCPVPLNRLDRYDNDLLSILKFAGKTNEQFTRMLLNVTIMASGFASRMTSEKLSVLDPLCGRGTTLNQALMYGYDASGIEIDKGDFDTYNVFINRWLKDKRIKHKSKTVELRKDGMTQAHRLGIQLASTRAAFKQNDVQTLDVVNADTLGCREFFKASSFEILLADLPYGIKHGNKSVQGLARSPMQLLEQAIPVWGRLLRPGGAIGLSWNTYLAKKPDVIKLLRQAGLQIFAPSETEQFRHRVDQAIIRDIVIAIRPEAGRTNSAGQEAVREVGFISSTDAS